MRRGRRLLYLTWLCAGGLVRFLPLPALLAVVERLGRAYAWLGLRVGWLQRPRSAWSAPSKIARSVSEK